MRPRLALSSLILVVGGCLPDGLPVDGRSLFSGRTIERPGFLKLGEQYFVEFEVRTAYPMGDKAGASDLWMTGWDEGGPSVLLMANKSDRWPVEIDGARLRY